MAALTIGAVIASGADLKADLNLATSGIQNQQNLGNVVGGNTYTFTDNLFFQGGPFGGGGKDLQSITFDDDGTLPGFVTSVTGGTTTRPASSNVASTAVASTITVVAPCTTGVFGASDSEEPIQKQGGSAVQYVATAVGGTNVTTADVDSTTAWVNITGNVTNLGPNCAANRPPVTDAGEDVSGSEGSAIELDGSGSSDPDGDLLTYAWTIDTTGIDAGGSCSFDDDTSATPQVTCTDDGVFTATLTVTDPSNASDSDDATVTVGNVDPVISAFACPTDPVAVNTSVALGGSFGDAGANDTHNNSGTGYDWDDGATTLGNVNEAAGSGSVAGSHMYTAAGIYTPSLTVTDDDGGSDTGSCMYIVVYDPSAGFVTGGGWIDSPAGAYKLDLLLSGKATFGFVSKYKKGATTPDGNTEFQFHAAGLNFKSTSYQWLVVSGNKATYKGAGTINGGGNYGFLLSAIDETLDKFRIKIWDKDNADSLVYDNGSGGDDANPTTVLGGGSIVIHTGGKK